MLHVWIPTHASTGREEKKRKEDIAFMLNQRRRENYNSIS